MPARTGGARGRMPARTVVAGGIWSGGPTQHGWFDPNTPCQLTLQPPSWLLTLSALGPVTTILPMLGDSGSALLWLRSRTRDSCDARRARSLFPVTAASALLGST